MGKLERQFHDLISSIRSSWRRRVRSTSPGRTETARKAEAAYREVRSGEAGRRAQEAIRDFRDSETARKATEAVRDLRDSETARRATDARLRGCARRRFLARSGDLLGCSSSRVEPENSLVLGVRDQHAILAIHA